MATLYMQVDRRSPIPAYHQISSNLIERVNSGEWALGDRLPSEAELATQYGVSRITLRQALSDLEAGGLITRMQGKGAFLTGQTKPFVEDLNFPVLGYQKKGKSHNASRVLELRVEPIPPHFVQELFQPDGESRPMVYLCRLFLREGRALGLNHAWFPADRVPGMVEQGLIDNSITTTLNRRYHYQFARVENYIEAASAQASEAALLGCPYNASLLKIQSSHYLDNGDLIEHSSTLWLGSLTRFHLVVEENIR